VLPISFGAVIIIFFFYLKKSEGSFTDKLLTFPRVRPSPSKGVEIFVSSDTKSRVQKVGYHGRHIYSFHFSFKGGAVSKNLKELSEIGLAIFHTSTLLVERMRKVLEIPQHKNFEIELRIWSGSTFLWPPNNDWFSLTRSPVRLSLH